MEIVTSYKYLGTIFDDHLKFDVNTEAIVKRGQQRIHLLRKLNSFSVSPVILCRFYQSFIESPELFFYLLVSQPHSKRQKQPEQYCQHLF